MAQIIKRGILQSFDPTTYTASVLIIEATSAFLAGVPVSNSIDSSSAVANAFCAVLFFNEHDHSDAVIIAVYPNGSVGVPSPSPSRIVLVPLYTIFNGAIKPAGSYNIAIAGAGGTGVPATAKAALFSLFFFSPTVGALCEIYPLGGSSLGYILTYTNVANVGMTANALVPFGFSGGIGYVTLTVSGATGTLYLYVYAYV